MPFLTGHMAAASNRADLMFHVDVVDHSTNAPFDLTGAVVTLALRTAAAHGQAPILQVDSSDGHIVIGSPATAGGFDVHISRNEMTQFPAGDLDIGVTIRASNGVTYQGIS